MCAICVAMAFLAAECLFPRQIRAQSRQCCLDTYVGRDAREELDAYSTGSWSG